MRRRHSLILVGGICLLITGLFFALLYSGLLPPVSGMISGRILQDIVGYSFWLALCVTVLGIGLAAWNSWTEKVQPVDAKKLAEKLLAPLQGELEEKNQQIKALIEAVTALSAVDAPAKTINDALQALEQGDTAQARAVFAEVLRTKETEGRKANKEAAAAARHLGALAFLDNTEEALTAYQKATSLDPDNADGWNQLGRLLRRTGKLDQAEQAYRRVLALGETGQDRKWQAIATGNLGNVYWMRGELEKAEEMFRKSLEISKALGLKETTANQYGNLGNVYQMRGELDRAEEMFRQSLEINQALGHRQGMAKSYGNLGIVYQIRNELKLAKEMYRKSLEISEALGLKETTANQYGNLGNVYYMCGELDRTEEMHRKSLELNEALGRRRGMASDYGNLGLVYQTRGELKRAEEMHRKSLEISEALGLKESMANSYGNLGNVYRKRGELNRAEGMYRKSLEISEALGLKEGMAIQYANLGLLYKQRGDFVQAEQFWKKSLRLFQEMKYPNAEKVQQWLDALAPKENKQAPIHSSPRRHRRESQE